VRLNGRQPRRPPLSADELHDDNLELARLSWQAVANGDVDSLRELWSDDIVWHVTDPYAPWFGDLEGIDAVFEYLAQVGESGETYDATLDDILISKERILTVCHVRARRGGILRDLRYCLLSRVDNGRIAETWTIPLDPGASKEFYALQ